MSQYESATVAELIKALKTLPQTYQVFLSSDSEGNSFGTVRLDYGIGTSDDDKTVTIYPCEDHLDDEQINPLQMVKIMKEIEEENLIKKQNAQKKVE